LQKRKKPDKKIREMNVSNDDAIGTADAPEIKEISDQISEKGLLCGPLNPLSPPFSHPA